MSLKNNRKYQQQIQLMDLLEAKKNGFNSPHLYKLSKQKNPVFLPSNPERKKQIEKRADRQTFPRLATISALAGFMMDIGGMTFPPPFPFNNA